MAQVGKSSGINFMSIWNELEKAASSHPRALTAAAVALAALAYLSSKSRYFFRWPVAIAAATSSVVLARLAFRAIRAIPGEKKTSQDHSQPPASPLASDSSDRRNVESEKGSDKSLTPPPVSGSSDKREVESGKIEQDSKQDSVSICLAILAELARQTMNVKPEISWPIDEELRTTKRSLEEDLFATLAREAFEESVDFEKEPLEDARLVAVALSDLSDERKVKSESDILLDALTQKICEELIGKKLWEYFWLYVAQNAITCCFAILHSRLDGDNFSDRVKQSLFNAEKIWAILPQKNLSCSLEGIFMITNHLTEEEKKALLDGLELPETFHDELKAFVTGWNILEPLRKKGYSLEEVATALILMPGPLQDGTRHNLVRRQAQESIDLARQVSALMNQYGYGDHPFRELLSTISAMKEQLGSHFNGMLAGDPEIFCGIMDASAHMQKTIHFLARKGYTKNEIMSASAWVQQVSMAMLQGNPSLASESLLAPESLLEDAIKTAREFSSLFQKHGKPQHSIEELLPAANDVRLERKKSLEDLLKEDPEVLYAAIEGKIFAVRNPGLLNTMSNLMSGLF